MAKDLDFDQIYPNRFIKSGEFNDHPVTLTITDVRQEELEGSKGKQMKVIVAFKETKKEWVAPKTCGIALKGMFGRKIRGWIGKRVTLYPTEVEAFGQIVPAIRVKGSPDLDRAIEWEEQLGRAKVTFKVVPTGKPGNGKATLAPPPAEPEPPESTDAEVDEFNRGFGEQPQT